MQADDIWFALQKATTREERPALHFFNEPAVWRSKPEELCQRKIELAEEVSSALELVIENHLHNDDRVIIEGVWITPKLAHMYRGHKQLGLVRSVFVDEQDQEAIWQVMHARGRGFSEWPQAHQEAMARMQALYGQWLRREVSGYGLPLVSARPVETLRDRVSRTLEA